MFYTYGQNNSGGSFVIDENVGQYVIVEADTVEQANDAAESRAGLYFDGCDQGVDCSCCGDRWYRQYYKDDGNKEPMIYGKTIEEFKEDPGMVLRSEMSIHVYYQDGRHEKIVFDAVEAIKKRESKKRKAARKLWGNFFGVHMGTRNKNPIRFYERKSEWSDESTFYDKTGNLSIEEGLNFTDYGLVSFTSERKADVIAFMEGAEEVLAVAIKAALDHPPQDGIKGNGIKAAAKLFANIKRKVK